MTRRMCLGLTLGLHGCGSTESSPLSVRLTAILGSRWSFLMESLGLFKKEGLTVRFEPAASTGKIVQALIGGSTDIAFAALDQIIHLATQGKRLKMFFTATTLINVRLYAASGAKSPVRTVADLKGRTVGIATFGSSIEYMVAALLRRHGMAVSDIERVASGSLPSAFAALESGKVDAAGLNMQFGVPYERKHPEAAILMDLATVEGARRTLGIDSYPLGLIADTNWLNRNRDAARRIARAWKAFNAWMSEHTPEEIREATPVEHRLADVSADLDSWTFTKQNARPDGRMPANAPEQVRDVVAVLLPNVRDVDLSQTWTNEFVEEARK
jgi:NitT/TauT family transport system substrate-binding protein